MLADEIIILVHCKREGSERKFRGWRHGLACREYKGGMVLSLQFSTVVGSGGRSGS